LLGIVIIPFFLQATEFCENPGLHVLLPAYPRKRPNVNGRLNGVSAAIREHA